MRRVSCKVEGSVSTEKFGSTTQYAQWLRRRTVPSFSHTDCTTRTFKPREVSDVDGGQTGETEGYMRWIPDSCPTQRFTRGFRLRLRFDSALEPPTLASAPLPYKSHASGIRPRAMAVLVMMAGNGRRLALLLQYTPAATPTPHLITGSASCHSVHPAHTLTQAHTGPPTMPAHFANDQPPNQ